MYRTRLVTTAVIGVLALALAACGSSGSESGSGGTTSSGADSSESSGESAGGDADSVKITMAGILPTSHYISKDFTQYFIDQAQEEASAQGKTLTIDFFPDGQLGKAPDQITNMNNGVFDAGLVASPYDPSHMPLSDAFNLPFMAENSGVLARAYEGVLENKDSVIYQTDYADNHLVPLGAFALPTYQIALTTKIDGPDSLQGKKIRSGGGVQNDIIKAVGGTPVTMTTAEQYEGLQRGLIDGGIFNTPSMISNKTAEVLKSFTTNVNMGGFNGSIAISAKTWESLPEWAQQVLSDAADDATDHFADMVVQLAKEANETLQSEYGLTAVEFTDEQLATLKDLLAPVQDSWISQVKDRGADGEAAVAEATAAISDQ